MDYHMTDIIPLLPIPQPPYHEVEALARVLLPEIQAVFESEEGQRKYAEWKARHQAEQENKT